MSQGSLTIKLDNETKKEFNEFCEEIGINMTTAINMFIKKVVREQRIPFDLSLDKKPNIETLQALQESEDILNGIKKVKSYNSVDELFKDLNK
ncbi:type II toxin-antitoxin system RelB/DinJ family antitoxin [uncultured Fusobacterium sp.]|uniref:type II toxin-antitoxin system RelB/DinJ family antitoxin n=1 Tax=uncultured Fusobacterium sp. TaxID=159267 RepID=UPI0015A70DA0|nr:type II toxin-antitoxin system RelB/DinJ family antitoxin [uncultured Fusobacterium sp.]